MYELLIEKVDDQCNGTRWSSNALHKIKQMNVETKYFLKKTLYVPQY